MTKNREVTFLVRFCCGHWFVSLAVGSGMRNWFVSQERRKGGEKKEEEERKREEATKKLRSDYATPLSRRIAFQRMDDNKSDKTKRDVDKLKEEVTKFCIFTVS